MCYWVIELCGMADQKIRPPKSLIERRREIMKKLYTFLDDQGRIIVEVRAENHDQAVVIAQNIPVINFSSLVSSDTDFYSETIEE